MILYFSYTLPVSSSTACTVCTQALSPEKCINNTVNYTLLFTVINIIVAMKTNKYSATKLYYSNNYHTQALSLELYYNIIL